MLNELINKLKERYSPPTVPACRVCGGPLEVASCGGGRPTRYRCSSTRLAEGKMDWEHYDRSEWEDLRQGGDPDVLELVTFVDGAFTAVADGNALFDIVAERQRQIKKEGFSTAHDDAYANDELRQAAVAYALASEGDAPPANWPWSIEWWKPRDARANLVRATALLAAEIVRKDRAAAVQTGASGDEAA